MDKKKGFTLIELIIAMGIGFMILVLVFDILLVGTKGHSSTFKSFENQADIRYAIETTNNAIRFASVGFAVTENDFKPTIENGDVKGLVKPWSYIGLGPDKKSIVHYKYIPDNYNTGYYKIDVLAKGLDNLTYDLKFTKPTETQQSKIIRYILEVKKEEKSNVITTEVEAINALHIIDWGDAKNPSIALAYRIEETPEINKKPVAAISMVLDTSGSMDRAMDGTTTNDSSLKRLSILKNTLNDQEDGLFSIFKESDVFVSLVPFSYNANIPHNNYTSSDVMNIDLSKFYNAKINAEKVNLEKMVNALNADGATNTGDGMRRAYYQLKKFNHEKGSAYKLDSNQKVKNYMIVLVDGVTTVGSANIIVRQRWSLFSSWWEGRYISFIDDSNDLNSFFYRSLSSGNYRLVDGSFAGQSIRSTVGDGANLDTKYGKPYVDKIGNMIQNSNLDVQAFVIGYSNVKDDLRSVSDIAKALGIKVKENEENDGFINNDFVFVATDKESLKEAFTNIGGYISEELWQIDGPKLKP